MAAVLVSATGAELVVRGAEWVPGFRIALSDSPDEEARAVAWASSPTFMDKTSALMHDSTTGWTNRPGAYTDEGLTFSVRADGSRGGGRVGEDDQRTLVFLGDSFTFGTDVEDEQTTSATLSRLRPDLRVLNRGVPGYGFNQIYATLESLDLPRDSIVVVGVNVLEARRAQTSFTSFIKPTLSPNCEIRPHPIPSPDELRGSLRWRSHLRIAWHALNVVPETELAWYWPEAETALDCITASSRTHGYRLVLVAQPVARTSTLAECQAIDCDLDIWMTRFCADDVLCVQAQEVFNLLRVTSFRRHWTPEVHEVIAHQLEQSLRNAGWIAARP